MDENGSLAPPEAPAAFMARARLLGQRVVDILLPPACIACAVPLAHDGALCSSCWAKLRLLERPFCERLAIPFAYDIGEGALSAEAIADPPPFRRLRAVL